MDIHVSIAAEELFQVGPLSVTNSMVTMLLVMGFILIFGVVLVSRLQAVPGHVQAFVEILLEYLLGMVEGVGGKRLGRAVFPLVAGLFIFIILANYSGLLPGVGTIGYWEEETVAEEHEAAAAPQTTYTIAAVGSDDTVASADQADETEGNKVLVPFFRAPNADLNMTLALALVTFTTIQFMGLKTFGVRGRIKHLATPVFLFPIEVIAEFSRIISLSARLFGNVFAGEMLLTVMYAIASKTIILFALPVVFLLLETLFGAVQALVFALLTMIYIMLAAAHGDNIAQEEQPESGHGAVAAHGAGD